MNEGHAAALSRLIVDHIRLARSRCETLGWLIASILTAGTVTLTRLAACIDSSAHIASVHRRLERFFSDVRLNEADVARLVVAALSLAAKPWHLAIDRTNWQFGKTDLNLLVLSVAHGDVCIPLFWREHANLWGSLRYRRGCSSQFAKQRPEYRVRKTASSASLCTEPQ